MKRIVMIEDNDDHALLIRKGIEGADCEVVRYRDGLEAMQAFEEMSLEMRPHLIFLDINLPGMDGFGILKAFQKMSGFNEVPVVMLTTSNRPEEVTRAYQLGARGFLVKADDFAELLSKLKQVKAYWFETMVLPETPVTLSERKK